MKTTINHLVLLSVGFTFLLILSRVFYSGSFTYLFFAWNLFLAGTPLFVSGLLNETKKRKFQIIFFITWLLFFPNALYIITDLIHLRERGNVPLWFDVILIFSASINGLIMACISLQNIELFLVSKFSIHKTRLILITCLFLASFGVYLGRFLRWNSWDIIANPTGLITDAGEHFFNPVQHPRGIGMTLILTIFFSIFYFTIKKLPGMGYKPGSRI
ncbi:MAG: DUF1361 domain-containing protein [Ginsengibacter sp.]